MIYFCCDELRRNRVRKHPTLNGIDFLEVVDHDAPTDSPRQQTLLVRLLKAASPFARENVVIAGGERITRINVLWAAAANAVPGTLASPAEQNFFSTLSNADHVLVVRVDAYGDASRYRLKLVVSRTNLEPPTDFDPQLSEIEFSFKVECPTDFDCKPQRICPPEPEQAPDISYLAKDYASFRRLIFDRVSQLLPDWRERNPADLGVALVELLAYVGDHLSYQQDAIATEAYLGTARRRVSVRRHARLVDYFMHDGCNARTWVQFEVSADVKLKPRTQVMTRVSDLAPRIDPTSSAFEQAVERAHAVFETLHPLDADGNEQDVDLFEAHNELNFYTWSDQQCCLPRGATRAALKGHLSRLNPGDVLVFEEIVGPDTGESGDADPAHRHPVRLRGVDSGTSSNPRSDPLTNEELTEIEWYEEDALPFALCISSRTDKDHGEKYQEKVSVALGNIVLADHGRTIKGEKLEKVPSTLFSTTPAADDRCVPGEPTPIYPRFRPRLERAPLTQAGKVYPSKKSGEKQSLDLAPFDKATSATSALRWRMADVRPCIQLNDGAWLPERDLLSSGRFEKAFVVESEDERNVFLRFGDSVNGLRAPGGVEFVAEYRIGNGAAGNIGADALHHIVSGDSSIEAVRNPLPAQGGIDAERIEEVRRRAPQAFRTQERAVTSDDYAEVTQRHGEVQRAAATLRWTGSWHTVFLTVDRFGGMPIDEDFETEIRDHVERYRMAGHDLEVDAPRFVSLDIEMFVCVKPEYFRADVKRALTETFSSRLLPDGRRGIFHPDNFSFGQAVYLSPLYAVAHSVQGVASATITKFERQGTPETKYLDDGFLPLGRLEIARLDNDRNFPEHGVFAVQLGGGK